MFFSNTSPHKTGAKSSAKVIHIYELCKFFTRKSFQQFTKLSKIKMQVAIFQPLAFFEKPKSFPF